METENNKESKTIRVGALFVEWLEKIREAFNKEYDFYPSDTDITNAIAKRGIQNNLFNI